MKTEEQRLLDELYDRESREDYLYNRVTKGKKPIQPVNYPDARLHQIISFIKSGVRILGYCFLPFELSIAAIILILSEAIGIIEELV